MPTSVKGFSAKPTWLRSLWHPNIVAVHDRGEIDGHLWIAMDYVDGTDAAQLVKARYPAGMPIHDVCDIVTAVGAALDYAHSRSLLHRDVKPANILPTDPEDGKRRILLADFGIARPLADVSGLTATNFTVGTLTYAAPEQLMGADIDGRADQYALAATAFHLLAGTPPYQHSNPVAVISRHLTAPLPKLSDRRPELTNLDEVLARALAKDPADRFGQCRDFAAALARRADVDAAVIIHRGRCYCRRADHEVRDAEVEATQAISDSARCVDSGGVGHRRRHRRLRHAADEKNRLRPGGQHRLHPGTNPPPRPPHCSTARTASTTTMKSKRSTVPHTPYTPPITPLGGPFTHHAVPRDALPPRPSWTPTTRKLRAPRPSQPITVSSTVTGNPRPCGANLPSRAALEQTVKSLQALIPSC